MYLDSNTSYSKNVETIKHRNNVRSINGAIIKNGIKFDYEICRTTQIEFSVDQHLKDASRYY